MGGCPLRGRVHLTFPQKTSRPSAPSRFSRQVSHQEKVAVEELLTTLRTEDKIDGSAVKKQVEEFKENPQVGRSGAETGGPGEGGWRREVSRQNFVMGSGF